MLLQAFSKNKVTVLVVEPQDMVRGMMQDVLRKLGFTARGATTPKDASSFLEAERFDWILMPPPKEGDTFTAMHILGFGIRNPHWRAIRLSLLVGEGDGAAIAEAMEYGCLSWHKGPFTKESFTAEIKTLMDRMFNHGFLSDLVSATYLRDIAVERGMQKPVTSMENALVRLHPGDFNVLIESASSCLKLNSYEDSLVMFSQARLLEDPKTSIAEKKFNDVQAQMKQSGIELDRIFTAKDILGFDSVAIIDSDSSVQQSIERSLKSVGVSKVNLFSDGQAFMDWIVENEPDIVIMEWRIQHVSAAKILQRVAALPNKNPPQFVVVSSSITPADLPILKEFGVGAILSKPVSRIELMSALLKAHAGNLQQAGVYFEQRIRAMIRAKKYGKAVELSKAFFEDPQVGAGRKMLVQADFLLASKKFDEARDLCLKALSLPHDPMYGLQLLGKSFMGARNFKDAMKCFDRAQALSPVNVERICLMAMAEAEQGNSESAEKLLATAKGVDSKNEMVLETSVNVALVQGDSAGAKKAIGDLPNIMGVVAFQNNRAVALSKSGSFPESISVYENTLQVLPAKAREAHEIVLWNLALAYVKSGDLAKADAILARSSDGAPSRLSRKAEQMRKRITSAQEAGTKITLNVDDPAASEGASRLISGKDSADSGSSDGDDLLSQMSSDAIRMLSLVDFKPGDLGCFQLLPITKETRASLAKLLNSLPRFKFRWNLPEKV